MDRETFEKLVPKGFALLPEKVRKKIDNVAILIENEPSPEVRKREGLRPHETLLGLYSGIPLTVRDSSYGIGGIMPDTITLYQLPIEDEARALYFGSQKKRYQSSDSAKDAELAEYIKKVVADTIWHEIAHHFGMDEKEVRKRERERLDH
jgi:predicted Zn-dependent protease with MMP-like domain